MKVSGFTFVKNAIKYGYPVVESIQSILPILDEMIVCLGDSEDETYQLIESIGSSKIRIIHSVWDSRIREGGQVLAVETDKSLDATADESDWLFYIQADEVVHEQYHATIVYAMEKYQDDKKVEGYEAWLQQSLLERFCSWLASPRPASGLSGQRGTAGDPV